MIQTSMMENALRDWMEDQLNMPVIWAKQGGPQPGYPYGTLEFIVGPRRLGTTDSKVLELADDELSFTQHHMGVRELTLSCQVHCVPGQDKSSSAIDYLATLTDSLSLDSVRDSLYDSGVSIGLITTPVGLSFRTDTAWVNKANVDITIRVPSYVTETVYPINSVGITWTDETDTFTIDLTEV